MAGRGRVDLSIPSNEVYNALQTGVPTLPTPVPESFVSFRIFEQVKCITAPGANALWFMYEPVLMSKRVFDHLKARAAEGIDSRGRERRPRNGSPKEAEEGRSKKMIDTFKKAWRRGRRDVVRRSYKAWLSVAKESSYKTFADKVKGGQELIAEALAVK